MIVTVPYEKHKGEYAWYMPALCAAKIAKNSIDHIERSN